MFSLGFSQTKIERSDKPVHKIHISHADPALIAILLSGSHNFNIAPEHSTVEKNNKK